MQLRYFLLISLALINKCEAKGVTVHTNRTLNVNDVTAYRPDITTKCACLHHCRNSPNCTGVTIEDTGDQLFNCSLTEKLLNKGNLMDAPGKHTVFFCKPPNVYIGESCVRFMDTSPDDECPDGMVLYYPEYFSEHHLVSDYIEKYKKENYFGNLTAMNDVCIELNELPQSVAQTTSSQQEQPIGQTQSVAQTTSSQQEQPIGVTQSATQTTSSLQEEAIGQTQIVTQTTSAHQEEPIGQTQSVTQTTSALQEELIGQTQSVTQTTNSFHEELIGQMTEDYDIFWETKDMYKLYDISCNNNFRKLCKIPV